MSIKSQPSLDGPGTNPSDYLYRDEKWGVRAVPTSRGRMFFYVDEPVGGDDGSLDGILPWADFAEKYDPLFMLGDYSGVPTAWKGRTVFKDSCPRSNPHALPFFHPVIIDREPKPIAECRYMASFMGTLRTHPCRSGIPTALAQISRSWLVLNNGVWWSYDKEKQQQLRKDYLDLIEDTQFVLCPRGKGLNSIRFFETLRLGRIPVLFSNETKLPLEKKIPYDQFVVRVIEQQVEEAHLYVGHWLSLNNIERASRMAREVSLEHFSDPEKFIAESLSS